MGVGRLTSSSIIPFIHGSENGKFSYLYLCTIRPPASAPLHPPHNATEKRKGKTRQEGEARHTHTTPYRSASWTGTIFPARTCQTTDTSRRLQAELRSTLDQMSIHTRVHQWISTRASSRMPVGIAVGALSVCRGARWRRIVLGTHHAAGAHCRQPARRVLRATRL